MARSEQWNPNCHRIHLSASKIAIEPCRQFCVKMSVIGNARPESNQKNPKDDPQWIKHFLNLFSVTLPSLNVRQMVHGNEKTKDTNLLLITISDGVHKIGYLPREDKDIRLGDGSKARQAYLCKLGSILASKAGISSDGNKKNDAVWNAMPEVLFGYE